MDRREFLEASGVLAGGAVLNALPPMQPTPPMIGIQVGAVSFVDEGTDRVLADVLPRAHQRRMNVIAWFEDVFAADVPGFEQAREVMLDGQRSTFACTRNPNTRNFWLGLVEDYLRSYDVDGLMWGSERQGPVGNALVASHAGSTTGGTIACFCPYCLHAARARGSDGDRAREGFPAP